MFISQSKIDDLIASDGAFLDLTTELLRGCVDLGAPARLSIVTRQDLIFSGGGIAREVAARFGCETQHLAREGSAFCAGDEIFSTRGSFESLHKAWKIVQIVFEYSCKISTYTHEMVALMREANPRCVLGATRKSFPFAKELCVNALIAGGGTMHRLGLHDSVLFFSNHIRAFASFGEFCAQIAKFKERAPERKIMIEVASEREFSELLGYAPDAIMCDKMSPSELRACVLRRDETAPQIKICAAGGINKANCAEFAATGADVLVSSAVWNQGVCDLGGQIEFI